MTIPGFNFRKRIPVRWADFDMLAHINNARYLTYAEQARTEYLQECLNWNWQEDGIILARAEIDFRIAIELQDEPWIAVRTTRLGTKSFTMEYLITVQREGQDVPAARIICVLSMLDYKSGNTYPIPESIREKFIAFEGKDLEG